jgi:hypothetical protein
MSIVASLQGVAELVGAIAWPFVVVAAICRVRAH